MEPNSYNNQLIFFLNGNKVIINNPNPELTLLTYLRSNAGLTGTKLGCGEGGCGACTVMLSHHLKTEDKIVHRSINSCLLPLCSVAGCAVTTIEGLGNVKDGMHPVQQRLSDQHGSQCGFCTPGIIMALYSYLRSHPNATQHEIEECFDGNLCRCTGYRPILDAARSFGVDQPKVEEEQPAAVEELRLPEIAYADGVQKDKPAENICPSTGKPCDCKSKSTHIPSQPLDLKSEPIFPPFLMTLKQESLKFNGDRVTWYTPTTLNELLNLKRLHNNAKIVVGNTEVGIETKFRNIVYPVIICPSKVPELQKISQAENGIEIGSTISLTDIKYYLVDLCKNIEAYKTGTFKAMLSQFRWFAGNQIRNAACLAGNLVTASPISDINPVLLAAGAILTLVSINDRGERITRKVNINSFFKSYRVVDIQPDEILTSIFVPYTRENEYIEAYKQSRRRDDDIAIVSCCFRVLLAKNDENDYVVQDCTLAYGGMNVKAVTTPATQELLQGQVWQRSILEKAYQTLEKDLPLQQGAPGGMIEYRRSLTTSYFFKFFLTVSNYLYSVSNDVKHKIEDNEQSVIQKYQREMSSGEQTYQYQPLMSPVTMPIKHQSADKQVTGEALYTDDIKHNAYSAAMVLSTKAHARIKNIDSTKALSMPGVKGIYFAKDIEGVNQVGPVIYDEELFASSVVLCVGYPIGVAVAETHQQALEAAKAVVIEYEELPAVTSIEQAIAEKSFLNCHHVINNGDIVKGFEESEHVIEGEMKVGAQEHFYLETNAALVIPGEGSEFMVYSSTQNPTKTQSLLALTLGVPANQIVVKRMGGGFGGKETRSIFSTCIAAVAAQKLRHPVRIMLDRDVDMMTTGTRHPFIGKYKIGFDKNGKIMAADIDLYADAGYSFDLSVGVLDRAMFHSENAYKVPNIRVNGRLCKTNLPTNTAFRGFGGPQGMIICEIWMEKIANYLKKPPTEIRQLNFYKEGEFTHYLQEVKNCQLQRIWDETLQKSDYFNRLAKVEEFNRNNKWKKRGIAIIPTKFGMSFTVKTLNQAGALVHVYTDGTVLVTHGGTEMGQGLHTKMIQIAAKELGVPVDKVYISETSTDKVANTAPTAASVSSDMNGMAVLDACQQINARLAPLKEKNPNLPFQKLVGLAFAERVNLSANGFYATPNVGYFFKDSGVGDGLPFNYFNYGCACSEVEIDTLTGDYTTLRTDIIMDVGDSLNPAIDIGQVEGAYTQGVGWCTLEEIVTFPNGNLFTRGPSTYKIPGFNDVPIVFNVSLLSNAPNPKAIHSSKGVGEPPLFLGSAVYFAIRNAIMDARNDRDDGLATKDEWFNLATPATCERIRNTCIDKFTNQFNQK
ncbi:xanthine dehydrogenase [Heterostelium album PN500]|uniref:xanthine dehydrogenase n=1 Tax=Heterostelium pallidum (strain ATCC 26659 / Pp 5 / PN500) TaxID=670386 RepID=D3BKT1_HETP5|nr:xanthine dehydrogenase [Heterostelium album PN500]EFA78511.1 xanthine dehydrogenase [Heterostelium album PN500]|eukprot:XP_020430635.1 xanthine dehydrogenase [Heterostelium album PN500]